MKKVYSKPDVFFEDFSLSTNIAAGCEKIASFAEGECGIAFTDTITLFNNTISECTEGFITEKGEITGAEQYDGLCYHNPSEDFNLFRS